MSKSNPTDEEFWIAPSEKFSGSKFATALKELDARPDLSCQISEEEWDHGQWPFVTCYSETTTIWIQEGETVARATEQHQQCDGAMDESTYYTLEVRRSHPRLVDRIEQILAENQES